MYFCPDEKEHLIYKLNLIIYSMKYLDLFLVCKTLICILYSVAAVVLVSDTFDTYRKNADQLFRRRLLALSYGALGVLYFCQLVGISIYPHFFAEKNYVGELLLLILSVFPFLLYLLCMVVNSITPFLKTHLWTIKIVLTCFIVCYVVFAIINRQWSQSLIVRIPMVTLWTSLLFIQVCLIYKMEGKIKSAVFVGRYIRVFAYFFASVWAASFPALFLFPHSIYGLVLEFAFWTSHGCMYIFVCKRDPMRLQLLFDDTHIKAAGVLSEATHLFNNVVDTSMLGDLYDKLINYFTAEKPYLKSGINVSDIAIHLSSNKTYLSRLLNGKLNLNFNQFVNSYRIKEAQRIVVDEGPITLETLCRRVGFVSMATFTVAFKLNTGMTPGEWCKKQRGLS